MYPQSFAVNIVFFFLQNFLKDKFKTVRIGQFEELLRTAGVLIWYCDFFLLKLATFLEFELFDIE